MNHLAKIALIVVALVVAFLAGSYWQLGNSTPAVTMFGRFLSTPKVEMLDDGRKLRLLEDFIYVDPSNNAWIAPKGRTVDGASIPKVFWSISGGPLTGKYRNASIVHDIECDDMKKNSHEVHLMFYNACLAGGVPIRDAKKLYWAVLNFGPNWNVVTSTSTIEFTANDGTKIAIDDAEPKVVAQTPPEPSEEDVAWANQFFDDNDTPVDAIPHIRRSDYTGSRFGSRNLEE